MDRRTYVRMLVAGGLTGLAGCGGEEDDEDGDEDDEEGGEKDDEE
jgi:hypothetical protein